MERIVIEVDDATAKKWQTASSKFKKVISRQFAADIDFITQKYNDENFSDVLDEVGKLLEERGLTEKIVNEILNTNA